MNEKLNKSGDRKSKTNATSETINSLSSYGTCANPTKQYQGDTTMTTNARPPPESSANNQRIVDKLVEREFAGCASYLIDHFAKHPDALKGSDYNWEDDVLPICVQDDWETTWEDYQQNSDLIANDESKPEDCQAACEALGIDEPHRNEAYEHWIVTDWFGARLAEHGEMVGELFNLTIWGRCTTGQSIAMDGIIQKIACDMEILTGQANEWEL